MPITYQKARADHEYLWRTYGPACDMTGSYVDSEDLARLLRSPTKTTARDCYCRQIRYWFQAGPDRNWGSSNADWRDDPKVKQIARRHDLGIMA